MKVILKNDKNPFLLTTLLVKVRVFVSLFKLVIADENKRNLLLTDLISQNIRNETKDW